MDHGDNSVPRPPRSPFSSGMPPVSPGTLAARKSPKRRTVIASNIRSMFKIPHIGRSSSDDASDTRSVGSFDLNDLSVPDSVSAANDKPKRRNSDTAVIYEAQAKGFITAPQDKPARRLSGSAIGAIFKPKNKSAEAKISADDSETQVFDDAQQAKGLILTESQDKPARRASGSAIGKLFKSKRKQAEDKPKRRGSGSALSKTVRTKIRASDTEEKSKEEIPKSGGSGGSGSYRKERKVGKETDDGSTVDSDKTKKNSTDTDDKPKRRSSGGAVSYKGSKHNRTERGTDDSSTVGAPKPKRNAGTGKDASIVSPKPRKKSTVDSGTGKDAKSRSSRDSDRSSRDGDRSSRDGDKPSRDGDRSSRDGDKPSRDGDRSSRDGDKTTTTKKRSSKKSDKSKSISDSVSGKDTKKTRLKATTSGGTASTKESKSPGSLGSKESGKKKVKSHRADTKSDDKYEKKPRGNSLGPIDKDRVRRKKKHERRRSFGDNEELDGLAISMPDLMSIDGFSTDEEMLGTFALNDAASTAVGILGTLSLNGDNSSSTTQQGALAADDVPIAVKNDEFTSVAKTIKASSLSSHFATEDPVDAVEEPESFTKRPPLRRRSSLSAMGDTRPETMRKPVRRNSFGDEGDVLPKEEEVWESKLKKGNMQKRGSSPSKKDTKKQVAFTEDKMDGRWNTQKAVRSTAEPVRQLQRAPSAKEKEMLKRDLLFNKLEVVRLRQSLSEALDKAIKLSESQRQERKEFAKATTELMQLKMEQQNTLEERRRLKTDLDIYKDSLYQKDEKIDALTGAVDNQLNKVEHLEEELVRAEDDLFKMEDQIREFEEAFPGIGDEPVKVKKSMRDIADDMDRKLEENSKLRRLEERQEMLDLRERELEAKERTIELKLTTEKDGAPSRGEVGDQDLLDDHVSDMLKEFSDENKKLLKELVEEKEKASAQLRMKDDAQDTLLGEMDIMKDKLQVMQKQVDSSAEEHNLLVKSSNQELQGLIDENSKLMEKLEHQKGHLESGDDVEEQVKEKDKVISDLTTDIEDLQEELAKLKKEKKKGAIDGGDSDLLKKIASLKKANILLKEQFEAEQDKSTNVLHDEADVVAMLKTKVSRLQLDLESSKSVNTKILESESRLKDKLAASQKLRDSESDRMQEAIDTLLVEKKTLEEEMKDGRKRMAVSLKTKDDTIVELQAQISGLKDTVNVNSSSVSTELDLQKSRCESLQVELDEVNNRSTHLEGAIEELQAAKRELESKALTLSDEQNSELEALKAEVDEWKSKTSVLQEKVKDAASQVADWKRRAQEWEKEASEWESVATGAQSAPTGRAPPQSLYLSAANTGKKKEETGGWGGLTNMFSRHSDHARNASIAKLDEDDERFEKLEAQNTALKETLTKLQCQLAEQDGE
jgi:hypothetical protein